MTSILDRMLHRGIVINIRGNSCRWKERIEKGGWKTLCGQPRKWPCPLMAKLYVPADDKGLWASQST